MAIIEKAGSTFEIKYDAIRVEIKSDKLVVSLVKKNLDIVSYDFDYTLGKCVEVDIQGLDGKTTLI